MASFNPRARVGRDLQNIDKLAKKPVSIHAPAWGATSTLKLALADEQVSIHAPAWGATATFGASPHCEISFNPRARVGRDTITTD